MEKLKDGQYRQGDVLLERIPDSEVPPIDTLTVVERDRGRIVLAYGEATGHAHAIASKDATLYALAPEVESDAEVREMAERATERFLKVAFGEAATEQIVALGHEQHPEIELPSAWYKVTRQVEYTPEAVRTVAD